MTTGSLYRLSALAGLLSGVCIIIGKLLIPLSDPQPGEVFDLLSPFFALYFAVGLYLGQRKESGILGIVSFVLMFAGLAAVVSLDYFGAFIRLQLPESMTEQLMQGTSAPIFISSLLVFLVGELLFGVAVIKAGVFSKVAAALFMVGLFPVALHPTGVFPESVVEISSIVAGVGLIWWSYQLNRLGFSRRTSK
jgi:hypothetical protein